MLDGRIAIVVVAVVMLMTSCGIDAVPAGWKLQDPEDEIADERERYEDECWNGGCDYDYDPDYEYEDECQNGGCDYEPLPQSPPVPAAVMEACAPTPPCAHSCVIDVASGASDCDLASSRGGVVIDMTDRTALTIRATVSNAHEFAFHLGDSPSNNGYGGDGAEFSNDAELHLFGNDLRIYGSDYSLDDPDHIRELPDLLAATGGVLELTVADGALSVRVDADPLAPMCFVQEAYDLLRLNAEDHEGTPDALWYMGLNETHAGAREGSGLQQVELCFH